MGKSLSTDNTYLASNINGQSVDLMGRKSDQTAIICLDFF